MRTTTTTKIIATALACAAMALVAIGVQGAAGASGGTGGSTYAPKLTFPMSITTPAGTITLTAPAQRIISLSPTATEILYAIGAGKQVIAVDTDSNYPTKGLPTTRFNAFSPNVEQMISLHPGLVVLSYNPSGLEAQLKSAGIPVMEQDAATNLTGTLQQITWLGNATGHYDASYKVASDDKQDVAHDVALVPKHHRALKIYFELDPQLYSLTSSTYAGELLKALGATNIADKVSTSLDGGYPKLSAEYVVASNPQMIFLADTKCCHQTYATVRARPGFSIISAVTHHFVIGLDDDIASRWGPRVSTLMDDLTAAVLRYYRS
jgi:iron complex transport system substrate-binding protein